MVKVLVCDGLEKKALVKLERLGVSVIDKHYEVVELKEKVKEVDCVVVRSATKIRKDLIDEAIKTNKLKLIIRGGVGLDNIDVNYAEEKGIKVANTPNASSTSVAELVLAHMLCLARFLNQSNITMRDGKWNKKIYEGIELSGKTLGIIGIGRIGKVLAVKASVLGMDIIYYDSLGQIKDLKEYKYVSFDELLEKSDFISLHVPTTDIIIGEKEINKMKKGAFIINSARGKVIDEEAILNALNSEKLGGVGLDVFNEEPTKNKPLINHPRVSVTPHIGAATEDAQKRIGEEVVSIIDEYFKINN
ncbi:MAG: D-2-hydroxyacid dehydrogenase [Sarcina sp.]